jgi:N-methylhydantoinase B
LVEGRWNFERSRRSKCPPWGLWGGLPGEAGGNLLKLPGEKSFQWQMGASLAVPPNSTSIVRTGGGGGWGNPLERPAERVAEDVAEGFVSRKAARDLYGVALRGNLSLDESATRRLRTRLRSARKARSGKRKRRAK